jgi:zinc/manganese transport system ATP-binding protein/zinc transport system ATP-binding protein
MPDSPPFRPIDHGPPPGAGGPPLVCLRDATIGYDRTAVLAGISMEVRRGEFLGLVGPSGAGKTSILRAILGQARRFGGELRTHPSDGGRKLRVGYVPQVEVVDWNFPITVEQVVLLGRWRESGWLPWPRARDRALARQVLERLGIAHLASRQIRALSGGQQQRVFLARALIGDPELLLLDEPTSGVDIRTRHEVMHLLGELNRAGTTIMLTTHELNAVATHLPRLVCIGQGRIIADGRPADVLTPEVMRRTYGAEMMVIHKDGAIYVVEHAGVPLGIMEALAREAAVPAAGGA